MEDLKFTTAGEYMDHYNSPTLEERYENYVALADKGEELLTFDEWLNR
jgi:hypothetical protein